jgi:hypothetical protein
MTTAIYHLEGGKRAKRDWPRVGMWLRVEASNGEVCGEKLRETYFQDRGQNWPLGLQPTLGQL